MAGGGRKSGDTELILAMAAGATVVDAAARSGMAERTVYRRIADPEFSGRVDAARAEMFARAVGQLASASELAVNCLVELLANSSPTVALGAAKAILDAGPRLRDAVELAERIRAIEVKLEEAEHDKSTSRRAA
jgi:hypothetical protein